MSQEANAQPNPHTSSPEAAPRAADREDARLVLSRTFPVAADVLYRAWTEPGRMALWLAPGDATAEVEADARPGGRYRVTMHGVMGAGTVAVGGEFRELVPGRKVVLTWQWEGGDPEQTLVTVELTPRGANTEMVVTHDRFLSVESRDNHADGWGRCFDKLAGVLGV